MNAHSTAISAGVDLFVIPVVDQFLVYAPLRRLAALVNRAAVRALQSSLLSGKRASGRDGKLTEIADLLSSEPVERPQPKQGALSPAFLGLLPTRTCNFACHYCGFLPESGGERAMTPRLARDAVNWYMDLVDREGRREAEIHFFGGEPFCAPEILDLTVHLARMRAEATGCTVRFEVATNGAFGEDRCRWAADNLDTIVLSFDGPADLHNRQRPYRDGRGSFEVVVRSAEILSEGAAQLFLRACITAQSVERMPEMAAWFCSAYRPAGVCFEPVQPGAEGEWKGFHPPDPWTFADHYIKAARILEAHGVAPMYATANVEARRVSFCPVGQDVVIVSPGGELSACYLLRRDWEARGMDLTLGQIGRDGRVALDDGAVAEARRYNVLNKPFCSRCFCRWHCAGGCHVNHRLPETGGRYDRLCLQTRIISLRNVLASMGRDDLVDALLADSEALNRAIWQRSDALV